MARTRHRGWLYNRRSELAGATVGADRYGYTFDAFGNFISKSGTLADFFRHRFSTKYYDAETGLHYYGYRFYSPSLMRWINRDPIEECSGYNLLVFCINAPIVYFDIFDIFGLKVVVIRHLKGIRPFGGWGDNGRNRAQTHYNEPNISCKEVKKGCGKIGFNVEISPPISMVYIFFREDADLVVSSFHENEHLKWIIKYDNAIETFKNEAEAIEDCPDQAYRQLTAVNLKLNRAKEWIVRENNKLDAQGWPHGH